MKKFLLVSIFATVTFAQTFAKLPQVTTCNVVGNHATDDTVALQACIDAAPNGSKVIIPSGVLIVISSTIHMDGRFALTLEGQAGIPAAPSAGTPVPSIYWNGPAGGTMLSLNRCGSCTVKNLAFYNGMGYNAQNTANIAIDVDQTVSASPTATNDLIEQVSIIGVNQNLNFQAIRFAQATPNNNVENMTVRDSVIFCSYGGPAQGQGIVIGPGGFYNAKKHLYQNNKISACATGIYLTGGSASILQNDFNLNTNEIYAAPVDPLVIEGNNSENSVHFFTGPLTAPILMNGNRIASTNPPVGQASVWITHGGGDTLTFHGNKFDSGNFMPVGFDRNNVGGSLNSSGNSYPYGGQTLQGFYTVPYNLTSMNDGVIPNFIFLMSTGACCANDIGGMGFDAYSQRWMVSTNVITDPFGHTLLSDPTAGFTFLGVKGLGTCASGNDLTSNSTGRSLSSLSTSFTFNEPGGFISISGGVGFVPGTYYVSGGSSGSVHNLGTTQTTGSNGFGASFVINRGRMSLVQGSAGVADTMWVCAQITTGYAWKQVF